MAAVSQDFALTAVDFHSLMDFQMLCMKYRFLLVFLSCKQNQCMVNAVFFSELKEFPRLTFAHELFSFQWGHT